MAKKTWKLSASFIASFKACPYRCYLKYVLGLVPIEDTDALRMGTNWHRLLEIMGMRPETVCPECSKKQKITSAEILLLNTTPIELASSNCPLCEGTDILPADMMDAVVRQLNQAYETVPLSKTKEEWLAERAILLYSIAGYNWQYIDDLFEVVAEEIQFSIPVRNPKTGRALPNVVLNGKIDKIVKSPNGIYYIDEHKSTSKALDSDSLYWKHLTLDTQTLLYPYAAQQLQLAGDLEDYGIKSSDPLISGVRYDAWHKPQIKPKKLTQAESKKFVEDGEYMGDKFEVAGVGDRHPNGGGILINNERAEIEPGAKEGTFAIRETPDMFGARLLKDIGERPEFYFCRKEIARTESDLKKFEQQIYNIYHTIKFIERNNAWWENESQCEATFRCPYLNVCYNGIDVSNGQVPEGLKLTKWKEKENVS
ncbi:MAG TPA: PD-(D/E)XK nuclease family protein [bacterium]|nr:PD-(D/E)XK nuclease family protein [bacterium]